MEIGSVLAVILYPCLFMYFQNADQSKITDIFPALGIFSIVALFVFGISIMIMRTIGKAALFTDLFMFLFVNYNTLFGKASLIAGRKVTLLICFIALAIFCVLIKRKCKSAENLCRIIGTCFGILILINFVMTIPTIASKLSYTKMHGTEEEGEFSPEKPNVYYFIFDEYAGKQGLERYYATDNWEFLDELQRLGFNISNTSHNTESCSTTVNIPNLLNLSYVADEEELESNNLKYLKNPKLYQIFKKNGYTINLINHTDFLDDEGCNVLVTSGQIDTISTYTIQKSMIQVFMDYYAEIVRDDSEIGQYTTSLRNVLGTMEICPTLTDEDNPTLTIGYISCPHIPFVVDENGERISKDMIHDWQNKALYLNQLAYINSCVEKTVENIIQEDPDAVIILQSDHGVRYPLHMEEMNVPTDYNMEEEIPYMQNILNCVYSQGKKIDIEGKTGINTLRTVLNDVFGTDYKMIQEKAS